MEFAITFGLLTFIVLIGLGIVDHLLKKHIEK
jgi:hypothetical protein